MLAGVTESSVHEGNRVEVLQNGAIFPAMLEDIAAAEHGVHLETFVWTKGKLENAIVKRWPKGPSRREGQRAARLARGVRRVRRRARAAESERRGVASYCKPSWWNWRRFNHRTHRKVLVVDGRVGYVFGHGVADQWLGNGEDSEHWRDTGLRLEGRSCIRCKPSSRRTGSRRRTACSRPRMLPRARARGDVPAHVVSSATATRCRRSRCSTRWRSRPRGARC